MYLYGPKDAKKFKNKNKKQNYQKLFNFESDV